MTMPQTKLPVLSTLADDGGRVWLKPRLSKGRYYYARLVVAWFLIALFVALPWIRINGKPAILLDIVHRKFHLFGYTFLPTDTLLLALFLVALFVSIFLFTALLGRLWCGWACPQTVYMEFVYRPLERLFDGTIGKGGKARAQLGDWRKAAYVAVCLVVSLLPAHTFLAYFVGVDELRRWITQSPLEHPTAFLVMAVTTLLMMFDFYYFREQMCILACPYGRFQSVLLDPYSLIVSYDKRRGEPRGKLTPAPAPSTPSPGDCVDCRLCVATCPTGIDIRDGLQMECINCTQCIDACDAVMDRIHKPRGLIRYSSQTAIDGGPRKWLRPRVILYPAILLVLLGLLVFSFQTKGTADVTVLRSFGMPFTPLPTGEIGNAIRLKITNRTDKPAAYRFEVLGPAGVRVVAEENPLTIAAGAQRTEGFLVALPKAAFHDGTCDVIIRVSDGQGFSRDLPYRLLGPATHDEHEKKEKEQHSDDHH